MFKVYSTEDIKETKVCTRLSLDKTDALILKLLESNKEEISINRESLLSIIKDVNKKIETINNILNNESLKCEITFKCN